MATGVKLVRFIEKDRRQWRKFHGVKYKHGRHFQKLPLCYSVDHIQRIILFFLKMLLYTLRKILPIKKARVKKRKKASVFFHSGLILENVKNVQRRLRWYQWTSEAFNSSSFGTQVQKQKKTQTLDLWSRLETASQSVSVKVLQPTEASESRLVSWLLQRVPPGPASHYCCCYKEFSCCESVLLPPSRRGGTPEETRWAVRAVSVCHRLTQRWKCSRGSPLAPAKTSASRSDTVSTSATLFTPVSPGQRETSPPLWSLAEDERGNGYCTFLAGRSDPAVQAAAAAAAWFALRPVLTLAGPVAVWPVAVYAAVWQAKKN